MAIFELKIAESIDAGFSVTEESEIIPQGVKCTIYLYESSCPDVPLAYSLLKFGDEILRVHQRNDEGKKIEIKGNGTDRVSINCYNECNNTYYFNAYLKAGYNG